MVCIVWSWIITFKGKTVLYLKIIYLEISGQRCVKGALLERYSWIIAYLLICPKKACTQRY